MPAPPLLLAAAAGDSHDGTASASTQSSGSTSIQSSTGSAAATAPAKAETPTATPARDESAVKEMKAPAAKAKEKKKDAKSPSSRRETFAKSTQPKDTPLTFAGGEQPGTREPAGNKKNFTIAAVLVLAAAGAVYFGWPQLQPLLANLPIVEKYFPSQPAPAPAVAPTPAAAPLTGPATGSSTQPTAEAPAPPANASLQNSSPAAIANQPAAAGKSADNSTNPSSDGSAQQPLHVTSDASGGITASPG